MPCYWYFSSIISAALPLSMPLTMPPYYAAPFLLLSCHYWHAAAIDADYYAITPLLIVTLILMPLSFLLHCHADGVYAIWWLLPAADYATLYLLRHDATLMIFFIDYRHWCRHAITPLPYVIFAAMRFDMMHAAFDTRYLLLMFSMPRRHFCATRADAATHRCCCQFWGWYLLFIDISLPFHYFIFINTLSFISAIDIFITLPISLIFTPFSLFDLMPLPQPLAEMPLLAFIDYYAMLYLLLPFSAIYVWYLRCFWLLIFDAAWWLSLFFFHTLMPWYAMLMAYCLLWCRYDITYMIITPIIAAVFTLSFHFDVISFSSPPFNITPFDDIFAIDIAAALFWVPLLLRRFLLPFDLLFFLLRLIRFHIIWLRHAFIDTPLLHCFIDILILLITPLLPLAIAIDADTLISLLLLPLLDYYYITPH